MLLKNVLPLVALFVFMHFTSFAQNKREMGTIEVEVGDVEIEVDVEIGRKKLDCAKFGVCSFPDVTIGKSYMTMSYNSSSKLLILKIEIDGLKVNQPDKVQYFEGKNEISIEESWTLPPALESKLKLPKKFVGKEGRYKVHVKDGFFLIGFRV